MNRWWEKKQVIDQLVNWSYGLHKAHPHQRIISLGQSASWIVLGAGMIRKLRGKDANIGFIPFTGAFFEREDESESPHMEFNERTLERPPTDRLIPYFNLLSTMNAKPDDLGQAPKKVVIAEMIKSGNGLASFLDVMSRSDQFGFDPKHLDNIELYIYDTNPVLNKDSIKIEGRDKPFDIRRVLLNPLESDLMENITPHNRADDTSSRLVPMYRLSASAGEKGLEIIPNQDVRSKIKAAIHREIQRREQEANYRASHPA